MATKTKLEPIAFQQAAELVREFHMSAKKKVPELKVYLKTYKTMTEELGAEVFTSHLEKIYPKLNLRI